MNKEICLFYSKTNSCKHGDQCIKKHVKVDKSKVVVLKNLYLFPRNDSNSNLDDFETQIHVDYVYEDIFTECSLSYGYVTDIIFASNICNHLIGNIYIQFFDSVSADKCCRNIRDRTYFYKNIVSELGVMCAAGDGVCKDFCNGSCMKEDECSYVHPVPVSKSLKLELFKSQDKMFQNISNNVK